MATNSWPAREQRSELWWGGVLGGCAVVITQLPDFARLSTLIALATAVVITFTLRNPYRWIALFFICDLVLPPLPVSWGSSGPHLALLFPALGLIAGFIWFRRWRVQADLLLLSLLSLAAVQWLSLTIILYDQGSAAFFASAIRAALFDIGLYVFVYLRDGPAAKLTITPPLIRAGFAVASLCALIACLDFYFQWPPVSGYSPQFIWLSSGVWRRAQGVFYDASALGNFCAFALTGCAVMYTNPLRPLSRWLIFVFAVPLLAALVFSFSRGSLVNFAVALLVLGLTRAKRIVVVITAAAVAIGLTAPLLARGAMGELINAYILRAVASAQYFWETPGSVLSGRLQTWQVLGAHLAHRPVLWPFGVGYKALGGASFLPVGLIADNAYLSALVETGVFGLAALILLLVCILVVTRRAMASARSESRLLGTWMFCFWCGEAAQMLSGDAFTYWRVMPVYLGALALVARREK